MMQAVISTWKSWLSPFPWKLEWRFPNRFIFVYDVRHIKFLLFRSVHEWCWVISLASYTCHLEAHICIIFWISNYCELTAKMYIHRKNVRHTIAIFTTNVIIRDFILKSKTFHSPCNIKLHSLNYLIDT